MTPVAVVQGASRGLGLQFCSHLLQKTPKLSVVATCRSPDKAVGLSNLQNSHRDRLEVLALDVTDEHMIKDAAEFISQKYTGVDLVINCSAMLHPSGKGETSLGDVSFEGLQSTLATNTIGPLLVAKHFSPILANGDGYFGAQSTDESKKHRGLLINMSARVGSISDNELGGWYSYRMSKCALNMATRNLSIELGRLKSKRIICISLHPGTVDTDLSRPYHKNVPGWKLFSTEYSVKSMMDVIENLTADDSGKYLAYDGTEIPF